MDDRSPPEPEELLQLVKPELQHGERLLWAATQQPRPIAYGRTPWTSAYFAVAFIGLSLTLFFVIFGPLRQRFLIIEGAITIVGLAAAIIGIIAGIIAIGSWIERSSGSLEEDRSGPFMP